MQHFQRAITPVQGLDVAHATIGEGRPVVYIHGAVTTREEGVVALGGTLGARHRLICIDRAGHGGSGRDTTTGSAWKQAALIRGCVDSLGVERPVIVGHSFGGAVALAYALQSPEAVAGVVALAPIAFPEPRLEQLIFGARTLPVAGRWLGRMARPLDAVLLPMMWDGMFLPQAMTKAFRDGFPFAVASRGEQLVADGQDAALMTAGLSRSAMSYWRCQVPVEVIQGDRDIVVNPLLQGRPLAALLPRGTFRSLPGLGHMAHHFVPEVVLEAIDRLHALEYRAVGKGQVQATLAAA